MSDDHAIVIAKPAQLALSVERARDILAKAVNLDEVKRIRDQAQAMAAYVREQKAATAVQVDVGEIYTRATRRYGELTAALPRTPPRDRRAAGDKDISPHYEEISKRQAVLDAGGDPKNVHRAEKLAEIPEPVYEGIIAGMRELGEVPSPSAVMRADRLIKRDAARAEAIATAPASVDCGSVRHIAIRDIDQSVLADESIDMVFTDPPYHDEHVGLYADLGELAQRVLKPGGLCMAYVGKAYLPEVIVGLQASGLQYWWQMIVHHSFSKMRVPSRSVFENYRPILVFRKPGGSTLPWVQDVVRGRQDKTHHDWQQDEDAPRYYIDAYTKPGEVICDPFCGGGTTAAVCAALKRRFECFDADADAVKLTLSRVQKVIEAATDVIEAT